MTKAELIAKLQADVRFKRFKEAAPSATVIIGVPVKKEQTMDKDMQKALAADGEKLKQLTGKDHGPYFVQSSEAVVERFFTCLKCQAHWSLQSDDPGVECPVCGWQPKKEET